MGTDLKPLLTIPEAAEYLGVSVATAYRMRDAGQLPIIQLGGTGSARVVLAELLERYGGVPGAVA